MPILGSAAFGILPLAILGVLTSTIVHAQKTASSGSSCQGTDLQLELNALKSSVTLLQTQVQNLLIQQVSGSVYVRWGRTVCPEEASVVYEGIVGGSHYGESGGMSEYLCLPKEPEWKNYMDGFQSQSMVYGAEYQFGDGGYGDNNPFLKTNNDGESLHQHDAPCVLCHVTRRSLVTSFPALMACPSGWTKEYGGYLVAERSTGVEGRVNPVCMDEAPETVEGGGSNLNGVLFYNVEAKCGSLPCPRYVDGRELTCVVCSR